MPDAIMFPLHVSYQGYGGRCSGLWKFKHGEHPVGDVTESLLSYELEYTTIGHPGSILQTKYHWIFIAATHHEMQFIKGGRRKQDLITLLDILSKGE